MIDKTSKPSNEIFVEATDEHRRKHYMSQLKALQADKNSENISLYFNGKNDRNPS